MLQNQCRITYTILYICVRCGTGAEVVLQNCCRIILPGNNAAEPVQNHPLANAAESVQNHPLANAAESVQNHPYYTIYICVRCGTGMEVVLQNCCRIILPGIDAAEPVQNHPLVNAAESVQNHPYYTTYICVRCGTGMEV